MNKEDFDKKMENIENTTEDDVKTFLQEIDFDGEYDRLYLAYLMQSGFYQPEGNLSLDQIYSMNSLDAKMTVDDLKCLQAWEMEEMDSFIKKQKESASLEQIEEITGVCMGICKTLGEDEEYDGWFDDDEKNEELIQTFFEDTGLSTFFEDIKKERDIFKSNATQNENENDNDNKKQLETTDKDCEVEIR